MRNELPPAADQYERPYSSKEIIEKYGYSTYSRLEKDPVHRFRMRTGIELIHKEPSKKEFIRICSNWQAMSDSMKRRSNEESIRLFGIGNLEHYYKLITEYKE